MLDENTSFTYLLLSSFFTIFYIYHLHTLAPVLFFFFLLRYPVLCDLFFLFPSYLPFFYPSILFYPFLSVAFLYHYLFLSSFTFLSFPLALTLPLYSTRHFHLQRPQAQAHSRRRVVSCFPPLTNPFSRNFHHYRQLFHYLLLLPFTLHRRRCGLRWLESRESNPP